MFAGIHHVDLLILKIIIEHSVTDSWVGVRLGYLCVLEALQCRWTFLDRRNRNWPSASSSVYFYFWMFWWTTYWSLEERPVCSSCLRATESTPPHAATPGRHASLRPPCSASLFRPLGWSSSSLLPTARPGFLACRRILLSGYCGSDPSLFVVIG